MTGMDAWNLLAPIIANGLPMERADAQEAYILTYWALKDYDRKSKAGVET